jgi:hypothetical protein
MWTDLFLSSRQSTPSYGQLVREVNKVKRVEFCQMLIDTNETFDDIIFSDESSIQLHQNKTVMYRLKGSLPAALPKPKNCPPVDTIFFHKLLCHV